jgi:hypothetical protein
MLNLTEEFIKLCSTILGRFDSDIIDFLVKGFHNLKNSLPNNLKEKFERLIPSGNICSRKIQLAIINHFKQRYFSELIINNNRPIFIIEDELTLAYAFLLAQIDDQLLNKDLGSLKCLFRIQQQSVDSLFELYIQSRDTLEQFFYKNTSMCIGFGIFSI